MAEVRRQLDSLLYSKRLSVESWLLEIHQRIMVKLYLLLLTFYTATDYFETLAHLLSTCPYIFEIDSDQK